jgi:TolA-binding protein
MKLFPQHLPLAGLLLCLTACNDPEADFNKAQQANTQQAYLEFLERHPESPLALRAQDSIQQVALSAARNTGTVDAYQQFIARFRTGAHVEQARAGMEALEFGAAERAKTLAGWRGFLVKYPQSTNAEAARAGLGELLLAQALTTNSREAFLVLVAELPGTGPAAEAQRRIELLDFGAATNANDISAYERFLSDYPASSLATEARGRLQAQLEERDWNQALLSNAAKDYLSYWRNYPGSKRLKVLSGDLEIPGYLQIQDNRPCVVVAVKNSDDSSALLDLGEARKWGLSSESRSSGGNLFIGGSGRVLTNTTLLLMAEKNPNGESSERFRVLAIADKSQSP